MAQESSRGTSSEESPGKKFQPQPRARQKSIPTLVLAHLLHSYTQNPTQGMAPFTTSTQGSASHAMSKELFPRSNPIDDEIILHTGHAKEHKNPRARLASKCWLGCTLHEESMSTRRQVSATGQTSVLLMSGCVWKV